MITPGEIQKIANRLGIRDTQVEKDYVIGWILYGLSQNNYLKGKLIFKGGTALRKIHFKEYRLSEDLDFTFNGKEFQKERVDENIVLLSAWVNKNARISVIKKDEVLPKKERFKKEWNTNLVNQIKDIPDFDEVWRSLGKHRRKLEKELKN